MRLLVVFFINDQAAPGCPVHPIPGGENGDILGFQGLPGLGVSFAEEAGSLEGKKKVSEIVFSGQELGVSECVWTYCHSSEIPSRLAQSVM